jgi:hypothetical protein
MKKIDITFLQLLKNNEIQMTYKLKIINEFLNQLRKNEFIKQLKIG